MAGSASEPQGGVMTQIARSVGFSKSYNFWLWAVFGGVLLGFSISRLPYLDFYGVFCSGPGMARGNMGAATPGECFYYLNLTLGGLAIRTHLWCVLPAALLAFGQFVPIFRRKALWLHRINGWISTVLSLIGAFSALPMLKHTMGGSTETQSMNVLLLVIFVTAVYKGIVAAKNHRIQEHRDYMLRAWVYGGSVITLRLIMLATSIMMSYSGNWYVAIPCDKIEYLMDAQNATMAEYQAKYPECAPQWSGEDPNRHVAVRVYVLDDDPVGVAAAHSHCFGMSGYVAIILHFVAAETYIYWTSPERKVSKAIRASETNHAAKKVE
ncbi:hypothetical protein F4813DRAFT_399061 [Daldinia decipiens]|uniref:uncharacterized protein n=1 Tax=Daldinia decipiens TaxID=326647 RepID=UPI0020C43AE6|nr:uncharacterized protein F4813DRAFT_399061 [Daldinia decipiens]KAI1654336.1 hypothetical protein F4813DRAFT_399061 [Daldinia decipiens]